MKGITLQTNEFIASYDISALFTSVSIDPAINIIRGKLELDQELNFRTTMQVELISSLLEFCLKTIHSQFQDRFFEQLQGAAMGTPISPIVANLYMEDFEIKAINTAEYPPRIWKRYVDDTCVVIDSARKKKFLEHPHNQFTTEDAKADGSILFLDTIVMPQPDNSLLTLVYRKPTHTDLYLQWDSHHHLFKFSVINTLEHRAKTVCSNHHLLKEEEDHLNKALRRCKYPAWALNRVNIKQKDNNRTNQGPGNNKNNTCSNNNKPYIIVPYVKGMSESCKNICRKHVIKMYFKGGNTIRNFLVHPKDKDTILQKSGVIYRYKCSKVDCKEEYIEESGKTFAERFREHMRDP